MPTAIVTGASRGLGLALARALAERGWRLVIDAREAGTLNEAATELARYTDVAALAGDVSDPEHRADLIAAAGEKSTCSSTTPRCSARARSRRSTDYPLDDARARLPRNVFAPLALIQRRARRAS